MGVSGPNPRYVDRITPRNTRVRPARPADAPSNVGTTTARPTTRAPSVPRDYLAGRHRQKTARNGQQPMETVSYPSKPLTSAAVGVRRTRDPAGGTTRAGGLPPTSTG